MNLNLQKVAMLKELDVLHPATKTIPASHPGWIILMNHLRGQTPLQHREDNSCASCWLRACDVPVLSGFPAQTPWQGWPPPYKHGQSHLAWHGRGGIVQGSAHVHDASRVIKQEVYCWWHDRFETIRCMEYAKRPKVFTSSELKSCSAHSLSCRCRVGYIACEQHVKKRLGISAKNRTGKCREARAKCRTEVRRDEIMCCWVATPISI